MTAGDRERAMARRAGLQRRRARRTALWHALLALAIFAGVLLSRAYGFLGH